MHISISAQEKIDDCNDFNRKRECRAIILRLTPEYFSAGDGNSMNTTVIFREAAGSCGQESHRTKTGCRAANRLAAIGLWLTLVAAGGLFFSSTAAAQDDSWQAPPRRQSRSVATSYADEELPDRSVALSDDTPALPIPVRPGDVDSPSNSPSNAPSRREKARPAGEAVPAGEPRPTRAAPPSRRPPPDDEADDQGPNETYRGSGEECDGCDLGCCGPPLREMLCNRLWFRGEALLWWARGGETPPLLTTSPASTPRSQAGVLGQPDTTILFGDEELNTGLHVGSRMSFGLWLDPCQESGLEFSYLVLGENTQTFNMASTGIPILARPFYDVNPAVGAENSHVIAYPGAAGRTFDASSTENFQGAEVLWRRAIVRGNDGRIDLLAGYRYQSLTDGLEIADSATSSGTGGVAPAGTTINTSDTFHTSNDFNGADLGFAAQWRRNRWSFDTLLKIGIGQTHTRVLIDGFTTVISNGTNIGYEGGLLAQQSNIGTYNSRQFSMLPEIGLTLGYDLTPRLKATVGYTLLYWPNVARPGDQIDLNVDSRQFPPPQTGTFTQPAFALHTSDFWAQGVNLGLDYRF
jgi:hypothetical protein